MRTGIYFNKSHFADNFSYIERIKARLSEQHVECFIIDKTSDLNGLDVLFVLGGDGTILTVASECAKRDIKIIGINYGRVGFLAEFEPQRLDFAVDLVCGGNYKTVNRAMLDINVDGNSFLALNDVVIQRNTGGTQFCNTISLRCEIDGAIVDNLSSDGIIVSTPTGSTAYSLSAGGSILAPGINAFIMTPICAHSLHSRPIVFGDGSVVNISSLLGNTPLNLIVDGRIAATVRAQQTITVKKSKRFSTFITADDGDFYNKLLIKLYKWSK